MGGAGGLALLSSVRLKSQRLVSPSEEKRKEKQRKNTPKNGDGAEMFLDGDYLPRLTRLRPSTSGLGYSLAKMNGGGGGWGGAAVQDLWRG